MLMKNMRNAMLIAAFAIPVCTSLPAMAQGPVVFNEAVVITEIDAAAYTMASTIIGSDAYTADGTKIHEVSDIVLDSDNKAVALIVGVGGFLEMDETNVAIPMSKVTLQRDGDYMKVLTRLSKEDLKTAARK